MPARAFYDDRLTLGELRALGRFLEMGAWRPEGVRVDLPLLSRQWAISDSMLRRAVRRLAAWGYLRREREGRGQRLYALDWPHDIEGYGTTARPPSWEREIMRPLITATAKDAS